MRGAWTMWSIAKYFSDRHNESIDERLKRYRKRSNDVRLKLMDRVDQLEDDLARTLLLLQAVAEACVAKGVLTREEITAMALKVDALDGVADGKLDPQIMRPQTPPQPALSPEEHLRKLEQQG